MSNKTQLQTNNTTLDALITRVNAAKETAASLPEAGSGGSGGANVETCTVELQFVSTEVQYICYTVFNNNQIEYKTEVLRGSVDIFTLNNVACGSTIFCSTASMVLFGSNITGTAEITHQADNDRSTLIKAPTVPNEHCVVQIRDDD